MQQVNLFNPPGKVAVTYRELQYHSNWHEYNSKTYVRLSPTHSPSKRFTCCIYKTSLVQLFKKIIETLHFSPNLTSENPWSWYMTFDLINIQMNPYFIFDPGLVPIWLQLFKENQMIKTNIFHLSRPQMTLDLCTWIWPLNIWRTGFFFLMICSKKKTPNKLYPNWKGIT